MVELGGINSLEEFDMPKKEDKNLKKNIGESLLSMNNNLLAMLGEQLVH